MDRKEVWKADSKSKLGVISKRLGWCNVNQDTAYSILMLDDKVIYDTESKSGKDAYMLLYGASRWMQDKVANKSVLDGLQIDAVVQALQNLDISTLSSGNEATLERKAIKAIKIAKVEGTLSVEELAVLAKFGL